MSAEEPITVTLPIEMSKRIRAKIAENGYSDVLDVLENGLDALDPEDDELQHWLRTEVVASLEEYERDPSTGFSSEEIAAALAAEYALPRKAG